MESTDLTRTRAELDRGLARGWRTGAQFYVSPHGVTIADFAIGAARPGVPMTPLTLVEWGSATKPVTCAAAMLLWQRGLFDRPVSKPRPETMSFPMPGAISRLGSSE